MVCQREFQHLSSLTNKFQTGTVTSSELCKRGFVRVYLEVFSPGFCPPVTPGGDTSVGPAQRSAGRETSGQDTSVFRVGF